MPTKGSKIWAIRLVHEARSGLWFLPTVIAVGGVVLAIALITLDDSLDLKLHQKWPILFKVGVDGARAMLSAIASSMVTVAGVAFSITIVALSLASSQYTSRVLRTFLRDRANQTVLGTLIGVFAYCLIVLLVLSGTGDEPAPILTVFTAVILAFIGVGAFIYFIHHISSSIQASYILTAIGRETAAAIDELFPAKMGNPADEVEMLRARYRDEMSKAEWIPIHATDTGYIQLVDSEALIDFAQRHAVIVRMEHGLGEFVIGGLPLVSVSGARPEAKWKDELDDIFVVGLHQTVDQDVTFGARQIVDIAMKALSPGVNDTTTAVMCIDSLTALLVRLVQRRSVSPYRTIDGKLWVIAKSPTFESVLALSVDQIRQNASANIAVLERLLLALEKVGGEVREQPHREALLFHAESVHEVIRRTVPAPRDLVHLEETAARVAKRLDYEVSETGLRNLRDSVARTL